MTIEKLKEIVKQLAGEHNKLEARVEALEKKIKTLEGDEK